MNKFLCLFLTIVGALCCAFIPIWWILVIPIAIIHFFLGKSGSGSFLTGFVGVFLAWFCFTYIVNSFNDGILSSKIAVVFHLEKPILLIFITSIIGGLLGGMSALTGFTFQNKISFKRKSKGLYS